MSFVDAVRSGLTKYADFSGRARRSEYWWFILFMYVVMAVPYALILMGDTMGTIGLALLAIAMLGLVLPAIAVAVRRLHDTGRSGWWYLLGLVPFAGLVVLWFVLQDSQAGDNAYGPSPKHEPVLGGGDLAVEPAV